MEDLYIKFKHLIEYFIAHLEYVETNSTSSSGYPIYIAPILDNKFRKTGYGWRGGKIQDQISKWEDYEGYKICISIAHNRSYGYTTKSCYLNWKDTWLNIRP